MSHTRARTHTQLIVSRATCIKSKIIDTFNDFRFNISCVRCCWCLPKGPNSYTHTRIHTRTHTHHAHTSKRTHFTHIHKQTHSLYTHAHTWKTYRIWISVGINFAQLFVQPCKRFFSFTTKIVVIPNKIVHQSGRHLCLLTRAIQFRCKIS